LKINEYKTNTQNENLASWLVWRNSNYSPLIWKQKIKDLFVAFFRYGNLFKVD